MPRKLTANEIDNIMVGATFLGAGGGGPLDTGRELLEKQKETVEAEIAHMNKVLDMLRLKCWYYDQAIQDGSEDRIKSLLPDHLPDDIQPLYDHAHQ